VQRWRLSGWRSGSAPTRSASCAGAPHGDPEPHARRPGRDRSARRAIGVAGAIAFEPWIALLVPVGVFLVLAYNLELLEGRFHSDLWFGLAWGGFPVVCGYAAVAGDLSVAALLAAAFAVLLSLAQRALSNHVRFVRRRVAAVAGELELDDGSRERLDADSLIAAEERGLRLLAAASVVLAAALVAFRI
jgi:hypothetical protein